MTIPFDLSALNKKTAKTFGIVYDIGDFPSDELKKFPEAMLVKNNTVIFIEYEIFKNFFNTVCQYSDLEYAFSTSLSSDVVEYAFLRFGNTKRQCFSRDIFLFLQKSLKAEVVELF